MLIKLGDKIRTRFCEGRIVEIIQGKARGWTDTVYYAITVTSPRLHWKRRRQIIRIDEVKGRA